MSERQSRAKEAVVILQRLSKVRDLKRSDEAEEKALLIAHAALVAEPRELTHCELTQHYACVSLAVERCDCSECGETVMGWEKNWQYCPVCGSQVTKVTREDSPTDRMNRNAVKSAMQQIGRT